MLKLCHRFSLESEKTTTFDSKNKIFIETVITWIIKPTQKPFTDYS